MVDAFAEKKTTKIRKAIETVGLIYNRLNKNRWNFNDWAEAIKIHLRILACQQERIYEAPSVANSHSTNLD